MTYGLVFIFEVTEKFSERCDSIFYRMSGDREGSSIRVTYRYMMYIISYLIS